MTTNTACTHKIANHEHGTHACYVLDKCRCGDCREANTAYMKRRVRWASPFPYEPPPMVDAAETREHVNRLRAAGVGHKRIALLAGVSTAAVGSIVWGRHDRKATRIRAGTARKLLAVTVDLADGAKVDATEAHAIVDELLWRGWWKAEIGRRIAGPQALSLQLHGNLVFVSTLKTLRGLLFEDVPSRVHNTTGKTYRRARPYDQWGDIPETTEGVASTIPTSPPAWLRNLDRDRLFATYQKAKESV